MKYNKKSWKNTDAVKRKCIAVVVTFLVKLQDSHIWKLLKVREMILYVLGDNIVHKITQHFFEYGCAVCMWSALRLCLIRNKCKIHYRSFEFLFYFIWNFLILKNLSTGSAICCYHNKIFEHIGDDVHNSKN